ncbi:MAG: precorrin-6y C5,15-methyltransferase (decarboxylating) subunit CbiE [Nitrospirales bacterium]|nr:precorrin-6y C5,15-methyltransferase (decarboxylating) subunit CbiE [Nitrospirales bacterium]
MSTIFVIGIGYRPLDKKAREIMLSAEVILASHRLFEVFQTYEEYEAVKERVKVILRVDETMEFIRGQKSEDRGQNTEDRAQTKNIVLLASGDPLFSGIGRKAVQEFGKEIVEIIPDLSSIQLAFARIKEPWEDAFLMSLHGGPDPEKRRRLPYERRDIPLLLERHPKIAIFTDRENNPRTIAEALQQAAVSHQPSGLRVFVCEKLGYPDERVTEGSPEEIAQMSFAEPNVVIVKKTEDRCQSTEHRLGLTEGEIEHSRGLITKDEVRAVAMHKLRLPSKGVLWDIGAGSGALSIEAALLAPGLKVCAIEQDAEQIGNIRRNKVRFDAPNVEIIEGEAPESLKGLPAPDRVFIGGSGGQLPAIIELIHEVMPSGIIVVNATIMETLHAAIDALQSHGFEVDASQVSVSRMKPLGTGHCLAGQNPIFVIRGTRK